LEVAPRWASRASSRIHPAPGRRCSPRLPTILSSPAPTRRLWRPHPFRRQRSRPRHGLARRRPFRAASHVDAAPSGGSDRLRPGEVRRGRGVLFLDGWASSRTRSMRCASRSRSTWSASRARRCRSCSLPTSSSSRARTRVRAVAVGRAANAPRRSAPGTAAGCRRRCSTASTCASKCTRPSRATGP
jgi:hypothetical protein